MSKLPHIPELIVRDATVQTLDDVSANIDDGMEYAFRANEIYNKADTWSFAALTEAAGVLMGYESAGGYEMERRAFVRPYIEQVQSLTDEIEQADVWQTRETKNGRISKWYQASASLLEMGIGYTQTIHLCSTKRVDGSDPMQILTWSYEPQLLGFEGRQIQYGLSIPVDTGLVRYFSQRDQRLKVLRDDVAEDVEFPNLGMTEDTIDVLLRSAGMGDKEAGN